MEEIARIQRRNALRAFLRVKHFFTEHLALLPVLLYLLLSAGGLFYLASLLAHFDFDASKHIGIADFFTAIFSSKAMIICLVLMSLIFYFMIPIEKAQLKIKFLGLDKLSHMLNKPFYRQPLLHTGTGFILLLLIYAHMSASLDAHQIQGNDNARTTVYLNYPVTWFDNTIRVISHVSVITTTSRYVFIYQRDSKKALAIPLSNIASIVEQNEQGEQR